MRFAIDCEISTEITSEIFLRKSELERVARSRETIETNERSERGGTAGRWRRRRNGRDRAPPAGTNIHREPINSSYDVC